MSNKNNNEVHVILVFWFICFGCVTAFIEHCISKVRLHFRSIDTLTQKCEQLEKENKRIIHTQLNLAETVSKLETDISEIQDTLCDLKYQYDTLDILLSTINDDFIAHFKDIDAKHAEFNDEIDTLNQTVKTHTTQY